MDLDNIENSELLLGDATEETVPPALLVSAPVIDISFHPQLPILAVGLVTGEIEIYEHSKNEIVKRPLVNDFSSWVFGRDKRYKQDEVVVNHHNHNMHMHPTGSVSAMEFTDDGSYLVTTSSDRTLSVLDCVSARLVIHIPADEIRQKTDKGKKLNEMNKKNLPGTVVRKGKGKKSYTVTPNPHKHGISALNVCDENLVATGDDDGLVAIWDMRERRPVATYHEHGDYVSQLCYFIDVNELVSSSGDTCLGCYDVRAGKIRDFSEPRKDEINCFAFINSTGANNRSFIPSIMCGTPSGSLPIWKYGSWRRPYDSMEYHPRECESIVASHGEDTTFNHNMVLTGACDGLVRVLQMYPVRRNICQISARDYTYSHQNASLSTGTSSGNYVVRRGRGHEAISKMRVSHDSNVLAVSGSDNIIDFVDIHFLNDQKLLDKLRGKAEQRHMSTLRRMEAEADAKAEEEDRKRAEELALFKEEREQRAKKLQQQQEEEDAGAGKASAAARAASLNTKALTRTNTRDTTATSDDDGADSGSSGGDSSGSEPTEEDRRKSMAMKDKLIALLKERAAAKARAREEKERLAAQRAEEASSSDDEGVYTADVGHGRKKKRRGKGSSEDVSSTEALEGDSDFDSSDDADMFSSDDEAYLTRKKKQLRAKRRAQRPVTTAAEAGEMKNKPKKQRIDGEASDKKVQEERGVPSEKDATAESHEAQAKAAMEAYHATRQEKRERVAAAKWLKEERKKKINFTFEKRRRRVGGFFGDMVNRDGG